jgi:hypothetical protein
VTYYRRHLVDFSINKFDSHVAEPTKLSHLVVKFFTPAAPFRRIVSLYIHKRYYTNAVNVIPKEPEAHRRERAVRRQRK